MTGTDLSEERKALEAGDHIGYLIRRFATIKDREAGEHLVRDLATIRSVLVAREYSKQREEKLREEAIRLATLLHFATHDPNFTLENCTRLECRNRRAALAENGDSDG